MTRVPPNPLAGYEHWPEFARTTDTHHTGHGGADALARVLGVAALPATANVLSGLAMDGVQRHDGVDIQRVSWSTGVGPRTVAWLLRPTGVEGNLPGVLYLHCHGGYKFLGAEQLLHQGDKTSDEVSALFDAWYGGQAPASELAKLGFAVLAHDAFAWGSRGFDLDDLTPRVAGIVAGTESLWREAGILPTNAMRYNARAAAHEDSVAKAAGVLGTSIAGMVARDDLIALAVLGALDGVDASRLATIGFSGGGGRSLILAALSPDIRANVITCMMATFGSLMPEYLDTHSWLLNTPGLWRHSEWPDLALTRRDQRLLVQYATQDELFPLNGMRAAHRILTEAGASSNVGAARYRGEFYETGHVFDIDMQRAAHAFLRQALSADLDTVSRL